MRVGLIVYGLDRIRGGIGRYTLELIRALAEQHPRPEIFLLTAGTPEPSGPPLPFPVIPLPGCRRLPLLLTLGQLMIGRQARALGLDVIHDPTGVTPFGYCVNRVKTIVTVHDVFPWSIPGYSSALDTLVYRRWLPYLLPQVDTVITDSVHSSNDIRRYLSIPAPSIRVIPLAASAAFRPLAADRTGHYLANQFRLTDPYIFFVGGLTRRKNLARALRAFAAARQDYPHLRFVIAGLPVWQQSSLQTVIDELGLEESVIRLGAVSEEALVYLYNGATLFLFPSLYEGFGLPVLEAMACGTPVITANVSSLPEVAGAAAILVDPLDVDALAGALRQVLGDPTLQQQLRTAGWQQAQSFSWHRTAEQTVDAYQNAGDTTPIPEPFTQQ